MNYLERFITDFTNPLFFLKIYIFKDYWTVQSFEKYFTKYYIKVSFGSLIFLIRIFYI